MGTSTNKEQKIEVHINLNMDKNGGPSQKFIASANPNNPSTVINISGLNNVATEPTETSQTNLTNQSVRNNQNSVNTQNVRNSYNNENNQNDGNNGNNENNDVAAPMPFDSYQISSNNSSTNQQFDINVGGIADGIQKENNEKVFTNTCNGENIEINLGGNIRCGEKEIETFGKPTNGGNIDINLGENGRVEENKTETYGKPTNNGNIDINMGGNKRVGEDYKTPKETPDSKPKKTMNIGYLSKNNSDNNDDSDLGMSYNILFSDIKNIDESKELINKRVEEGYFPLFIQLDEEKPLFFFIKNYETVQSALEAYKEILNINDGNKEYTLYNKKTKALVPQHVPIKDLGLNYFSYISNDK